MKPLHQPFPVLGLTGGIAAGKTRIASWLQNRGWAVLDADAASRDAVAHGSEGLGAIIQAFGTSFLAPDGTLDRAALGRRVFEDPGAKDLLESLLHPLIETLLESRLDALPMDTRGAVLDAALWVETGQGHHFDALWVVDAPEQLRLERLQSRDGLDESTALSRLNSQCRSPEKALHADLLIQNDSRNLDALLSEAETHLLAHWSSHRATIWRAFMPAPFTSGQLHRILAALLGKGGDLGEIFVEQRRAEALGMDDGRMEDVLAAETYGASLRLMVGETTRFADLIAPTYDELLEAADLLAAPGTGDATILPPLEIRTFPTPTLVELDPASIPLSQKVALVRRAETLARIHAESLRPGALRQVAVGYGDSTQKVWIASAERKPSTEYETSIDPSDPSDPSIAWECTLTEDCRMQGVIRVNVTAGERDQLQTGYQALGESRGFEQFTDEAVERTTKEAVRLAIQALDALPAPAGTFPVILSSSAGGTMIHEACGHGLEADLALAGMSAFAGKLGEKVAAECVTIIDDGTLPAKRGSASIDDEGNATKRVVLIENGVLKQFLQSRKTARKMGVSATGNGRRENYRHLPIPRMRNTFLAPGSESPEAILRDLDRGLFVKHMGGGQVDTVTGNFVFQVTEGYWVEGGQLMHSIKNATLSGCGPEVLKQLTRIGTDLHHFDIGTCGKDGQGVPVSDALPTILCPALVVGGTAEGPAGTIEALAGTEVAPAGTPEAPAGTPEAPAGTPEAPAGTAEAPAGTAEEAAAP